ncbi:hypothetical protein I541_5734 [Mycobacteroides abscessus]|nr:hypothetical protein I541_5734 [Mycobacteroides abscessus]
MALAVLGPYPSGGLIANMPPTLLLAASSIVECLAVIAFAPIINRWVQAPGPGVSSNCASGA